jgi:hypothetical protein
MAGFFLLSLAFAIWGIFPIGGHVRRVAIIEELEDLRARTLSRRVWLMRLTSVTMLLGFITATVGIIRS